jgi:hypothetical protein
LYVSDEQGLSDAELRQELLDAARDEGLEFALRIIALEESEPGAVGAPIYAYKVRVADGREELIRGLRAPSVQTRLLKRILVAGTQRNVFNSTSSLPVSVVAPAMVFEELELSKVEEEFDKLPILKSPALRGP